MPFLLFMPLCRLKQGVLRKSARADVLNRAIAACRFSLNSHFAFLHVLIRGN
jgi:hypothetical protein